MFESKLAADMTSRRRIQENVANMVELSARRKLNLGFARHSNGTRRKLAGREGVVSVDSEATYICDACGEEIVIPIDPSEGGRQDYVEECPVCCNPCVIHVIVDANGEVRISAEPEQDRF